MAPTSKNRVKNGKISEGHHGESKQQQRLTLSRAKKIEHQIKEIVTDRVEAAVATEILLMGQFDGADADKVVDKKNCPRATGVKYSLAAKKNKDIIGVLPYVRGTSYPQEPVEYCNNEVCQARMCWYDIDMKKATGREEEVYLCSNSGCINFNDGKKSNMREMKENQQLQRLDLDQHKLIAEPATTHDAGEGLRQDALDSNGLASVTEALLDRLINTAGAPEPDMDIVDKAMKEFRKNGRKRKKPIVVEYNQFDDIEDWVILTVFGIDNL